MHTQILNRLVHFILDGHAHQAVTVRAVHLECELSHLEIEVTALVTVNEDDEVVGCGVEDGGEAVVVVDGVLFG